MKKFLSVILVIALVMSFGLTILAACDNGPAEDPCKDGHTWANGRCSVCNKACVHPSYGEDNKCTVCGKDKPADAIVDPCANGHTWVDGKCTVCNKACGHLAYGSDNKCTVCGAEKPEVVVGDPCADGHTWSNGKCTVCDKACGHLTYDSSNKCTVCGMDKPEDTTTVDPSEYAHKIIFYSSQGDKLQQKTKNAIAEFEAKYPGWTVEHITQGGYDDVKTKIVSDLQAGLQPDLAYCYADHVAQYIQTKKVIDMNSLIKSTDVVNGVDSVTGQPVEYVVGYSAEELEDFVQGYYAEGYARNFSGYAACGYRATSMLTLPFVKSTELLYYNKTALDACGLQPAKTWDELWQQAPILKARYPKATVLGYDSEANWFITMCEQNGWGYTAAEGEHFLFNNPQAAAWLDTLNAYHKNGWLTTQADYGAYTSGLFTKGAEDGGCIYCIGSSGGASYQAPKDGLFEAAIAPIPGSVVGDDVVNKVISQGPSLVMFQAGYGVTNVSEKSKMTFLFVKELLDPVFQAEFSIEAGYNPCRPSVYEDEDYIEHMEAGNMTAMACQVALKMIDDFFTSPAFVGSSTARTQVGNALLYAMTGSKTGAKALEDAYKNCGGGQ